MALAPALVTLVVCLLSVVARAQTLVKTDDGTGIHIYYRTGWTAPYIHYSTGLWTTSPGVKMVASTDSAFPPALGWFRYDIAAPATSLEFVFNNGAGTWDNNANNNYKVTAAGTYSLTSTISTPPTAAPTTTPSPAPAVVGATLVKADDGTGLHVYFRSGWTAPYIHYNQGSGWTTSPGVKMVASTDGEFPNGLGWFKFDFAAPAAYLEFVFNNNAGTWDNNGSKNYKLNAAGTWAVVSTVSAPPTTTPAPTVTPSPTPSSSTTPTPTATPTPTTPTPTGACTNFNGQDSCTSGTTTTYPDANEARRWQTPPRNASEWKAGFQDYRSLTGYAHVTYDASRTSATVEVRTNLRVDASTVSCVYSFNGASSSSATFKATSALASDLNIVATCTQSGTGEQWTLELDPVNFVWQATPVSQPSGMEGGQKGAIVDLFGWPYADIEAECKDFLGKAGYMGVKINPPQESVLSDAWPQRGERNPWYFIYQPVSYRLHSRMGTRAQLRSMIQTCRANGVRVYADAVVNHMSGGGNDVTNHRNPSGSSCTYWGAKSSAKGSPYYTHNFQYDLNKYTGGRPALEFPAVPFGPTDFHCERSLGSWNDALQLETGWLVGLTDLNTAKPYVRQRIAQYFVDLMGIGFSGFRVDAVKHIGPTDFAAIMGIFSTYMGGSLPSDFISWGEVIMGGEAQLLACNENSGYNFYKGLDAKYAAAGLSATDIAKLKIWSSDYPKEMPICGSWILPASRFVIQNDDHDQQNPDSTSRDMGDKGSILIKAKDVGAHRSFETLLFNRRDADWKIRVVLSSYTWFSNGAAGFPDGLSDCTNGFDSSSGQVCDKSVPYEKAFRAGSCGYTVEGFAGGKYTRVHRDLSIVNAMRGWVGLGSVSASQVGITGSC